MLGDWRSEIQGWHASTFYSDNVFHLSRED